MEDLQRQLLSVLVRDLGYTHAPVHGLDPIRHQLAWSMIVENASNQDLEAEIGNMIHSARLESDAETECLTRISERRKTMYPVADPPSPGPTLFDSKCGKCIKFGDLA